MWRNVAEVNIEAMFPQELSGVSIEAHDPFLFRLAFAGDVLQVDAIAHDDRR